MTCLSRLLTGKYAQLLMFAGSTRAILADMIDLSGASQTMLATLYAKALDADAEQPVLGDTYARDLVGRLDYDWSRTGLSARLAAVTMRC